MTFVDVSCRRGTEGGPLVLCSADEMAQMHLWIGTRGDGASTSTKAIVVVGSRGIQLDWCEVKARRWELDGKEIGVVDENRYRRRVWATQRQWNSMLQRGKRARRRTSPCVKVGERQACGHGPSSYCGMQSAARCWSMPAVLYAAIER